MTAPTTTIHPYDAAGNQTYATNALRRLTRFIYDAQICHLDLTLPGFRSLGQPITVNVI